MSQRRAGDPPLAVAKYRSCFGVLSDSSARKSASLLDLSPLSDSLSSDLSPSPATEEESKIKAAQELYEHLEVGTVDVTTSLPRRTRLTVVFHV